MEQGGDRNTLSHEDYQRVQRAVLNEYQRRGPFTDGGKRWEETHSPRREDVKKN